jgi:hypothetical protein
MSAQGEGNQKRNKSLILLSSLLLVFIIALGTGYLFVKETPRYSLYWFKKAILDHNAESALKYLDIDSIVDNMVKDMSGGEDKGKVQSKDPSKESMKNIGKDIIMQNLPTIKTQLREQLKSAIVSYSDRAVLDNINTASVLGLQIAMEGDMALVKIWGRDKVAFKMAKSPEGHWRIIAFNLEELTAHSGKSSK